MRNFYLINLTTNPQRTSQNFWTGALIIQKNFGAPFGIFVE